MGGEHLDGAVNAVEIEVQQQLRRRLRVELAQQEPYGEVFVLREQFDEVGLQGRAYGGAASQPGVGGGRARPQDLWVPARLPYPVERAQAGLGVHGVVDGRAFLLGQFLPRRDDQAHVRVRVGGQLPHEVGREGGVGGNRGGVIVGDQAFGEFAAQHPGGVPRPGATSPRGSRPAKPCVRCPCGRRTVPLLAARRGRRRGAALVWPARRGSPTRRRRLAAGRCPDGPPVRPGRAPARRST